MKNEDKKKLLLDLSSHINWTHSRQNSVEKMNTPSNSKTNKNTPTAKPLIRCGIGEFNKMKNSNLNNQSIHLNHLFTNKNSNNYIGLKYPVPVTKVVKSTKENAQMRNPKLNYELKDQMVKQSHSLKNMIERKYRGVSSSPNTKAKQLSFVVDLSESHETVLSKPKTPGALPLRIIDFKSNNLAPVKSDTLQNHNKSNSVNYSYHPDKIRSAETICTLPRSDHSNENKTTIGSDAHKDNVVFNTMYNKLSDFKCKINNKDYHEALQTSLITIFDTLGIIHDSKYLKIAEIFKTLGKEDSNLKNELEKMKTHLEEKEKKVKTMSQDLETCSKENSSLTSQLHLLKKQVRTMKSSISTFTEENKSLKNSFKEYSSEIEFLREKEMKMMEVMYVLKNKGICLDEVMNEISNNKKSRESLNDSLTSTTTVYFPDKINMKHKPVLVPSIKIPPLNFSNIPSYESDQEEKKKKKNK